MNLQRNILLGLVLATALSWGVERASGEPARKSDADRQLETRPSRPDDDGKLPARSAEDRLVSDGESGDGGGWTGLWRTIGALGLVAALIFVARYLLRRFGGRSAAVGRGGPIDVLARVPVAAKQHLLLVRFGERLVLAGSGPGALTTLSEITDPGEVERVLKSLTESQSGSFAHLFRKKSDEFANRDGKGSGVRDVSARIKTRLSEESDAE